MGVSFLISDFPPLGNRICINTYEFLGYQLNAGDLYLISISFQGYSVTTGDFNGDGEPLDVAVGMPRGHGLRGQVVIYDSVLNNLHNVTGYQIGAYFVSHLLGTFF